MKTRLIFLVLLIVCFSCGTNKKPISDAQKEKIKGEVKEVVNTIIKAAEEANSDMVLETYLDSPDFVFTYNGNSFSYKQCEDLAKSVFGTLKNQKCTLVDEKYAVLDNSTVLYTANIKWLENFKDGHVILQDPWITQILFKKVDNKWKVISEVESGIEQSVKNSETSKELNQVELMKQFLGNWKCESGKDTTVFWNAKPYGTGFEVNYKSATKGNLIMEAKQLFGYDKKTDKCLAANMIKGLDIEMWALWFTSNKNFEFMSYSDISNPEKAIMKVKGEFKSPDVYVETIIVNNKPVNTYTYILMK